MCGRYTLSKPGDILEQLGVAEDERIEIEPNYNVAPTQDVPIVAERLDEGSIERHLLVHLGLRRPVRVVGGSVLARG